MFGHSNRFCRKVVTGPILTEFKKRLTTLWGTSVTLGDAPVWTQELDSMIFCLLWSDSFVLFKNLNLLTQEYFIRYFCHQYCYWIILRGTWLYKFSSSNLKSTTFSHCFLSYFFKKTFQSTSAKFLSKYKEFLSLEVKALQCRISSMFLGVGSWVF